MATQTSDTKETFECAMCGDAGFPREKVIYHLTSDQYVCEPCVISLVQEMDDQKKRKEAEDADKAAGITQRLSALMVGLDGAGKTALLHKLKRNEVVPTTPTIGFNVEEFVHKITRITLRDVGGHEKIRSLWRHHAADRDALIFVVDGSDPDQFLMAQCELHGFLSTSCSPDLPVLVLANKADLPTFQGVEQISEKLGLASLHRPWHICACSALTGSATTGSFDEGFDFVCKFAS
ncbi:ADP-ribosylation factor 1 [Pelomyxa schiedti]|nr:ADP-ribosylation factor 1 [Pelomyxa schiedti]